MIYTLVYIMCIYTYICVYIHILHRIYINTSDVYIHMNIYVIPGNRLCVPFFDGDRGGSSTF